MRNYGSLIKKKKPNNKRNLNSAKQYLFKQIDLFYLKMFYA